MKNIILGVFTALTVTFSQAQSTEHEELLYSNRFTVMAGLIQPLALGGGNADPRCWALSAKRKNFCKNG
jgi:hypothetical protein